VLPSVLPTKTLCAPLLSPKDVTCSQSHSSCFDHLNKNWWEVHSLKLLI
jgi:hypothetical protein